MLSVESGFVLPVDKPAGPTSHDVVAHVRRSLKTRRVGHTGTLDPFATGLLLICVGPATRLSQYLTGLNKTYEAVARLGVATDTLDDQGEVISETPVPETLDLPSIDAAMEGLRGEILQVPPQFSAKKVDGEAMHRRARRGETLDLDPVSVRISSLEATGWDPPFLTFRVDCSSGTYIRALARDLGDALGLGGHLTGLRRTSVGVHSVDSAISLDEVDDPARVAAAALSPSRAIAHIPGVEVSPEDEVRLRMGQAPPSDHEPVEGTLRAVRGDRLVALVEFSEGRLQPRTVLPADSASHD